MATTAPIDDRVAWDPERAMHTIRTLRRREKELEQKLALPPRKTPAEILEELLGRAEHLVELVVELHDEHATSRTHYATDVAWDVLEDARHLNDAMTRAANALVGNHTEKEAS